MKICLFTQNFKRTGELFQILNYLVCSFAPISGDGQNQLEIFNKIQESMLKATTIIMINPKLTAQSC